MYEQIKRKDSANKENINQYLATYGITSKEVD